MKYYIKERNWEQILKFIKGVKGMHSKDENLNRNSMAKWLSVAIFAEDLW